MDEKDRFRDDGFLGSERVYFLGGRLKDLAELHVVYDLSVVIPRSGSRTSEHLSRIGPNR